MRRFAKVTGGGSPETIAAYMPSNYKVLASGPYGVLIGGVDHAGWTMDDYVIPRLGSGLHWATEIDGHGVAGLIFDAAFGNETGYPAEVCVHCDRIIVKENGLWVDPEATGDDSMWRETCDKHDTFSAEHEPA